MYDALLFLHVLSELLPTDAAETELRESLEEHAREFATRTEQSTPYQEALQITQLVNDISEQGPEARRLCQEVMAGVAAYVRGQPSTPVAGGWLR